MTQKTIKKIRVEIFSKAPRKIYATNKIDVYHIDENLSLDIFNLKVYVSAKTRSNRFVLLVVDKFSKFGWPVLLKNKNAQTIEDFSENILQNSKRKPGLIESDRGREF